MTKMTRIEFLAKGKGKLANKTEYRQGRITRTLEGFISEAKEKALEQEEKADNILNEISASADSTSSLTRVFNNYVEAMGLAEDYRRTAKLATELKAKLDEEVEVELDED